MLPLLKYAYTESKKYMCDFNANMTSNGYLLNKEEIEEMTLYNFTGSQITLDGDKEIHNSIRFHRRGEDTYTKIINNIHLLVKSGMTVTLRINCTHENIESISRIPEAFKHFNSDEKRHIRADLHIVWQEKNRAKLYQQMDKVVEIFNNHNIPTAKMEFRGFCYGDKRNSCVVNYNGDLYKCTAIDFHKTLRDGYLSENGDLIWENGSLEKRMASKFTNPLCQTCRILPLCHGGCTKQSLTSRNYCLHHQSDEEKDSVVMNRILYNSLSNDAHPL